MQIERETKNKKYAVHSPLWCGKCHHREGVFKDLDYADVVSLLAEMADFILVTEGVRAGSQSFWFVDNWEGPRGPRAFILKTLWFCYLLGPFKQYLDQRENSDGTGLCHCPMVACCASSDMGLLL